MFNKIYTVIWMLIMLICTSGISAQSFESNTQVISVFNSQDEYKESYRQDTYTIEISDDNILVYGRMESEDSFMFRENIVRIDSSITTQTVIYFTQFGDSYYVFYEDIEFTCIKRVVYNSSLGGGVVYFNIDYQNGYR